MSEQMIDVGRGIELCYETIGAPEDQPLVLIAGLGQQLLSWPQEFCELLADRGHYVIRFDNRDIGRSTRIRAVKPPGLGQLLTRRFNAGQYTLADMARDAVGLIEGLELGRVDLVGVSMGGMISQTIAAQYPNLVASLTSISSTTGHRMKGQPAASTYRMMFSHKPGRERELYVEGVVRTFRHVGSHGFDFDESAVRELAGQAFDRGHDIAGPARQIAAILASGNRTRELAAITAPTLVIHGDRDVLVNPSGGRATADAITGARLETIAGMGHDLPRGAWEQLVELIDTHTCAAMPAAV